MKINLEYHTNMHNQLNNEGNYLSEEQLDMQTQFLWHMENFMKYLKQEENCWGDTEASCVGKRKRICVAS